VELRPEDIAEILRIFNDSELVELRLDIGGNRLYLSKTAAGFARFDDNAAGPASVGAPAAEGAPAGAAAPAGPEAGSATPPGDDTTTKPSAAGATTGASKPSQATNLVDVRSPLLGVFYRRPAPDKPSFVEVGSQVSPEDPVCIIDVMKMFSRVPAGVAGRVAEILVEDGQLVEHGQVLMRLEPR
jgi:acetyl-CoA carboxylase biotin carboxyl carrier protein